MVFLLLKFDIGLNTKAPVLCADSSQLKSRTRKNSPRRSYYTLVRGHGVPYCAASRPVKVRMARMSDFFSPVALPKSLPSTSDTGVTFVHTISIPFCSYCFVNLLQFTSSEQLSLCYPVYYEVDVWPCTESPRIRHWDRDMFPSLHSALNGPEQYRPHGMLLRMSTSRSGVSLVGSERQCGKATYAQRRVG